MCSYFNEWDTSFTPFHKTSKYKMIVHVCTSTFRLTRKQTDIVWIKLHAEGNIQFNFNPWSAQHELSSYHSGFILCIRLLYHLAKNFKTCKKIICQPFLERQEICHPKIKTIYYTIDQGKILIILMVLSYITFNALSDVRIFLKLNQNISEYICLNLLNTLLSWLSCFWGIIFSPYEEMSSEYCYWKHLWCEEYIFYFNNKIRIMKSKKAYMC